MSNEPVWFNEIKSSPPCTDEQLKALGEHFLSLLDQSQSTLTSSPLLLEDRFPRMVFISISQDLEMAKVYLGKGHGMIEALKDCYNQFQYTLEPNNKTLFKIDVINKVRKLGKVEKNLKIELQYTLEGIGFSSKANFALLPEQAFCHAIFDRNSKLINYNNIFEALTLHPLASAHLARLLKGNVINLFAFKTKSMLIQEKKIRPLFRGNVIKSSVSQEEIKLRLEKAALYLARSINKNGKFNYIFNPDINYYPPEYNIPRHAGTLYSMFEYCEAFPNETVLNAAKRGLDFLSQQMLEGDIANSLCVLEKGVSKLGSNALSAIALQKYIKITNDRKYLPMLTKLGNFIVGKIQENGAFKPQQQFYLNEVYLKDIQSEYFPGEAALALLRIYSVDNNLKWLNAAENAINWLIHVRDKTISETFHDHWLTYSLNEIYQYRKKSIYLEHAKKICHSTLTQQIKDSPYPDWNGGYSNNPRSTPAATRGEGLCSLYNLFKQDGKDKEFLKTVLDIYRKIVLFELGTQYQEESTMYFSSPIDSLGAFHGSHISAEIRIDYIQHNISSILGYYKILTEN